MRFLLRQKKILAILLVVSFTSLTVLLPPVQAKMVSTAQFLTPGQSNPDREKLATFLEREDVQKQLEAWGLDSETARARLNSLTDEEVSRMAGRLDQLPAGGDGLGIVIGAALLVFLVLLFTDIMGWTDVFPFVKKHQ
jgi:hypothetical protein